MLAALFATGLAVMLFVVGFALLPPLAALVFAIAAATALTGLAVARAGDVALWMIGARPAQTAPAQSLPRARLHNLVESLCFSSGLPKPSVHVVDDTSMNAFAAGRGPRHAAVGVTSGLLEGFNPVELEAVLAHELSRVKSCDVLVTTLAVTMFGLVTSFLPSNVATRVVTGAIGAREDSAADITGVSLTRYPPGLISALEKLQERNTAVEVRRGAAAHLWLLPFGPTAETGDGGGPDARLKARIEALGEL